MRSIGESRLLQKLLTDYEESCRRDGTPEELALQHLRELFEDPEIGRENIYPNNAMDYLRARRSHECRHCCPGREKCPHRGYLHDIVVSEADGKRLYVVQPRRCPEFDGELREAGVSRLLAQSRIPESHRHCSFDNYRTGGLKTDVKAAKGIAGECAEDGTWLCLCGRGTGTGKTHLAVALLKARIAKGESGIFVNAGELYGMLHAALAAKQVEGAIATYTRPKCLVVDDIGVQHDTEWFGGQLYRIINTRHSNGLQTVVTSNARTLSDLSEMCGSHGDRIVSRLTELAAWFEIAADDYRKIKGRQRLLDQGGVG